MDKNKSLRVCSYITEQIIKASPVIENSRDSKEAHSPDSEDGLFDVTNQKFEVISEFCRRIGLFDICDDDYIAKILLNSKMFSADEFMKDPYLSNIKIPTVREKNNLLMNCMYAKNEIFQYDMPDLNASPVVPFLGFFDKDLFFPSVYEGNIPWVSVCPSEINSMKKQINLAFGKCLVLGLGLGYYPYMISEKENVEEITIVEINESIIELFEKYILPQFKHKEKIKVIKYDAMKYVEEMPKNSFDFCFADIWEGQEDGAKEYMRIKKCETKHPSTVFTYWIEEQLKWYIDNAL